MTAQITTDSSKKLQKSCMTEADATSTKPTDSRTRHIALSEIELSAYQFWKTQSRLAKLTMQLQHSLHQQKASSDNN